jgi:hypothetical protein
MASVSTDQGAIAVVCAVKEARGEDLRFTHGCTGDSGVEARRRRGAEILEEVRR